MTLKIINESSFPVNTLGTPTSTCTVRVPGVCGELVQGLSKNHPFLVACPIDFFSRVTVEIYEQSGFIISSEGVYKSGSVTTGDVKFAEVLQPIISGSRILLF